MSGHHASDTLDEVLVGVRPIFGLWREEAFEKHDHVFGDVRGFILYDGFELLYDGFELQLEIFHRNFIWPDKREHVECGRPQRVII